jgi:hypothetical protein
MMPPTRWQAQRMKWDEALKQDKDSYNHIMSREMDSGHPEKELNWSLLIYERAMW